MPILFLAAPNDTICSLKNALKLKDEISSVAAIRVTAGRQDHEQFVWDNGQNQFKFGSNKHEGSTYMVEFRNLLESDISDIFSSEITLPGEVVEKVESSGSMLTTCVAVLLSIYQLILN